MGFSVKYFDQILADMIAYIVANSTKLTDFTPGSVIRTFCEATSLSQEEIYVSTFLGFQRQLKDVPEKVFGFARKTGTKANGEVVFSRIGTSGDVTIPIGTKLKTPADLRFITTELGTILDTANDSNSVDVEADKVGYAYNVGSATITIFETTVNGVDTVTNANPTTGGVDIETDFQFSTRFQAYIEGLGQSNIAGLITAALSVDQITSASVAELFPPVANVNAYLYIDDGTVSGVGAAKVLETQEVVDGDGTEESPGYRAAGVNVVVAAPSVIEQDIEVDVTAGEGIDINAMNGEIETNLTNYINNLPIGGDIIYAELTTAVMNVFGVVDADVTTPSANVTIADSQVGRIGTITINNL